MKHLLITTCLALLAWPAPTAQAQEHRVDAMAATGFAVPLRSAEEAFPGGLTCRWACATRPSRAWARS